MPPKKKQKKATGKDTPAKFLSNSREALIKKLKKQARRLHDDEDYDRLVASAKALVETNNEIWNRCLSNKFEKYLDGASVSGLHFYRVGYSKVEVKSSHGVRYNEYGIQTKAAPTLTFTSTAELETRKFEQLPSIPQLLGEIFPFDGSSSGLQDYEAYLGRAAWLQEDVSRPFLVILKEHLKEIQVALGEIDSWLMEPNHSLDFLNEHFEQTLEAPQLGNGCDSPSCELDHDESAMCVNCFQPQSTHIEYDCDVHGYCQEKEQSDSTLGSYFVSPPHTIKVANLCSHGEITMTFKISSEDEQERLKKFVSFVDAEAEGN